MAHSSNGPAFKPSNWNDIITEVAVPLIARRGTGEELPSGTAFFIGPWFAVTARHLIEDYFLHFDGVVPHKANVPSSFDLLSVQVLDQGAGIQPLRVQRVWFCDPLDIAFLHVVPAGQYDESRRWKVPQLELLPPKVGEGIVAFGYPRSTVVQGTKGPALFQQPTTTVGEVIEVHAEYRDHSLLRFPCFRTNARFDGGMSGGPVINEAGAFCGVICSSIEANDQGDDHVSYASTLWPSMGTLVDLDWVARYTRGTYFPVLELAQAGFIATRNAHRVRIVDASEDERTIELASDEPSGADLNREGISLTSRVSESR